MKRLLLLSAFLSWLCLAVGQNKFESKVLQQAAASLSDEVDCASAVYQFAESYFNRLLSITPQERLWRMAADGVTIEAGKLENLSLVNSHTTLNIAVKDTRGVLSIANGEFPVISISFPMSYQLIRQKNQKELEDMLVDDLKTFRSAEKAAPQNVDRSQLVNTAPGFFVDKGNVYYIDAINNDLYYQEDKNRNLNLVCSADHLLESVANLLLEENAGCRFSLEMKVHRYGFQLDTLQVDLNHWIAYCKKSGCELFVGIKQIGTAYVSAAVFAVNHYLHYNHVETVHFPIAVLEEKKGILKSDAYVFIPTHNLSGLFEEMNFVTKKPLK